MKQQPPKRDMIALDPQRPGDRQRLIQALARIAWRIAKEQQEPAKRAA